MSQLLFAFSLTGDVLLLADVFENFRELGCRTYKLDPAYYLSSPQLSFDAALLHTEAEPELISDTAMYQMIDDGIRGGVVMISTRYARANNPEVEGFDPTKTDIVDQRVRRKQSLWLEYGSTTSLFRLRVG